MRAVRAPLFRGTQETKAAELWQTFAQRRKPMELQTLIRVAYASTVFPFRTPGSIRKHCNCPSTGPMLFPEDRLSARGACWVVSFGTGAYRWTPLLARRGPLGIVVDIECPPAVLTCALRTHSWPPNFSIYDVPEFQYRPSAMASSVLRR